MFSGYTYLRIASRAKAINIKRDESHILKKRVKRTFSIHHWVGIVAGIFILVSSITGSVLVFHHEIDHAQFADQYVLEEPASELIIDNSYEQISNLYAGHDIRVPDYPDRLDQALKYEIRTEDARKWIFTHPETGKILGTVARADQRLVHILLNIHYNLFAGTTGKVIVLLGGVALLILSITGFMVYRKSILKVLSFRQKISLKNKRTFFSSLHRVLGVWSLLFNLLITITGSWIAYTIIENAFSSDPPASKAPVTTLVNLSVDAALENIRKQYPSFDIKYLLFPRNGQTHLSALGRLESDPLYYGRTASRIQVDLTSGEIGKVYFMQDAPWGERMIKLAKPFHFGDFAGLVVKLIYSFFGIFPGVLAISGFFVWRKRQVKKSHRQKQPLRKDSFVIPEQEVPLT